MTDIEAFLMTSNSDRLGVFLVEAIVNPASKKVISLKVTLAFRRQTQIQFGAMHHPLGVTKRQSVRSGASPAPHLYKGRSKADLDIIASKY